MHSNTDSILNLEEISKYINYILYVTEAIFKYTYATQIAQMFFYVSIALE